MHAVNHEERAEEMSMLELTRTERAVDHLSAAEVVMRRAAETVRKVDGAEHEGARLLAWSAVFGVIAEASREIDAVKRLVADEMRELLEEGEALTARDRQALAAGVREIQRQLGGR